MNFENLREGLGARSLTLSGIWLIGLGSVATAAWLPTVAGRPIGTALSTLGVGIVTVASLARGARPRPLLIAGAALFLSTHLVGWLTPGPSGPWIALEELLALALLSALTADGAFRDLRPEMGRMAATLIGLHTLLLLGAWLAAALGFGDPLFEWGHEKVSALPRFRGMARNPIGLAVPLLCYIGLSRSLTDVRTRRATFGGGLLICVATFSFVTLLVPVLLLADVRRPWVRRSGAVMALTLAFGALYATPLAIEVGDRLVWERPPTESVGLREVTLSAGPVAVELRTTAYWELATGALECFADHPVTGVGPGAFADRCPVRATDTRGRHGPHRPHNFFLGLLAERGSFGAATFVFFVALFGRAFRLDGDRRRTASSWLILASAMTKAILHMPLVVLFVASSLRGRSHDDPEAP